MLNPNKDFVKKMQERIDANDGFCPCRFERNKDTICPCKYYREDNDCICGLYVNDTEGECHE